MFNEASKREGTTKSYKVSIGAKVIDFEESYHLQTIPLEDLAMEKITERLSAICKPYRRALEEFEEEHRTALLIKITKHDHYAQVKELTENFTLKFSKASKNKPANYLRSELDASGREWDIASNEDGLASSCTTLWATWKNANEFLFCTHKAQASAKKDKLSKQDVAIRAIINAGVCKTIEEAKAFLGFE